MAKYEVDRFESPPDPDLVCCICQCVLDKPLQSPCQHVFCKVCIETWLTNRKNCPNCRKSLRISKLKPVIPIVRNMINRLIIRCDNYSHGCIEGVKLEYYDVHVKQCGYVPLKCMNTGCEVTVLRKDMLAHEKECHFRLVVCRKGCGFPVAADQQQIHSCVAVLKANMECMEETFNKKYKSLAESFIKLQKKVDKLETKLQLQLNSNASRDSGNEDRSGYSTGATTPIPEGFLGEEEPNSQRSRNSSDSPSRENEHWGDTASDDSFMTGRGTPVNREDQHSNWSWLNSEEDGQSDVADLEDSAVDALLASDVDNTPSSPRARESNSEQDRRRHSFPVESYEGSRGNNGSSENAERTTGRSRTASQSERTRYSLRSTDPNNAADSTSNVNVEASSRREEDNHNAVTPDGSPAAPDSATNSDNDSFEPTGSDSSPVTSHVGSLRTSDTSPPSSPVSFNNFLNSVAQLNSSSDFTWSPSSDAVESSRHGPASSSRDNNSRGWRPERASNNDTSHRSSQHTEREDSHHSNRTRRRRSSVYYSSDEESGHRRSDHSRKRSRKR